MKIIVEKKEVAMSKNEIRRTLVVLAIAGIMFCFGLSGEHFTARGSALHEVFTALRATGIIVAIIMLAIWLLRY